MATSSAAVAGTNGTATQYNNLRTDAITRTRVYVFYIPGTVTTGDEQGVAFLVEEAGTVVGIKHKIKSGTSATFRIQKDTDDVDASIAATTTAAEETSITSAALAENQVLTLDVTGVSGTPTYLTVQVIVQFTV